MKDLKIAYIEPIQGRYEGEEIEVLFNPSEYTIEKGNTYQSATLPGLATPVSQFVAGDADTLTMELFFDTYSPPSRKSSVTPRQDVRDLTRPLSRLLDMDPSLHAPPVVRFVWGGALGSPEGLHFTAVIEKFSQRFTLFRDDGKPVRAIVNITFKEYKTVEDQLGEINRESADRTKVRIVTEGDSLWHLAGEEYDDVGLWRVIARENGIENPRLLTPGMRLEIPPLD